MKTSAASKTALGATLALGCLVVVAILAYHRQGQLAAAMALLSSGLVALVIQREMTARQQAEARLLLAQDQLEDRVTERTAEINTTNVALQAEVHERQRAEQALQHAHDELERRVAERTRALADANEVLQLEIVERRKVADALKNSRTLYHSLVENLPVNIWRTDIDGRFTFVNQHLCDCLGATHEEVLGRSVFDFYTTATAERRLNDDRGVLERDDSFEAIQEFETKSGRQGFEQILKTTFHDADGRVLGVQGISWDVTERKRAEEEMRHIQTQLERTNSDLRHKNQEVQNFYHTLSHELKTPLTSAREFIAIVMDGLAGELNQTQADYLRISLESCNQLRVCLNDLLDATRLETGKLSVDLKPGPLGTVAQRVVKALRPAAGSKHIELSCEVEPDLPPVLLDESRITQVISNLLNNALKFTDAGGRVIVRVGLSLDRPDSVEVSVSDTGCGIAAEQLGRVFDRLYQVKSGDATSEQGIGLGLYICRELVRLHGGNISVESEVGTGTTFTFTLPKAIASTASRPPRANLLVVDDDPAMREILSRVLEQAQFDVAIAEDGRAALQQIQRHVPDAVVMDLEMPGMDGPTTLREIRKHWGSLPVILHTGRTDGPLLKQALKWSPFTVLAKPCPMEQLIQTVRAVEQRRTREPAQPPGAVCVNAR